MKRLAIVVTVVALAVLAGCVVPDGPRLDPTTVPAPTFRDVAYGPMLGCPDRVPALNPAFCGGSQTLDIYTLHGETPLSEHGPGTIVFFHEGGWVGGDKALSESFPLVARQVARGWDVVSVNYRFGKPYSKALEDAHRAVAWLRQSDLVNTGRVVVAGHSAGATLAALVALTGWTDVDGWIGISPLLDLCETDETGFWANKWIEPADCARTSPVTYLDAADPSGYVVWDSADPVVSGIGTAAMRVAANGDRTRLWLDPAEHGGHMPIRQANIAAMDSWLNWIAAN